MKGIRGTAPYKGALIYKQWHKKEGRWYALIYWNDSKRTTRSWARYLLETKLGRCLEKGEEVDHIDGNRQNDLLDNLQVISSRENKLKTVKQRMAIKIKLTCSNCSMEIERTSHGFNKNANHFCSKKCENAHRYIKRKI